MSRAFVKEQDGEPPKSEAFDLPISPHPNLLTPEGYRLLESRLATLEKDLHIHIHKENNVLFPKAIGLEQASG